MRGLPGHLSVLPLVVTTFIAIAPDSAATAFADRQTPPVRDSATFSVILQGVRIGSELVTFAQTNDGWLISSTGRQAAPVDLVTTRFEMRYTADWQPRLLAIEGTLRGQVLTLGTTFGPTTATSDLFQGGQKRTATHQISPRAIVLPNNFFGAYEALASRLATATVGTRIPIYVAPVAEVSATVDRIAQVRVLTPNGAVELRQFNLTITNPSGALAEEVWVDGRNRLARLVIPAASLALVRDDLSSVMTREEKIRNPGDGEAFIPAAGFNLAATITKPRNPAAPLPAVVLVGGAGPQDRDEASFGIPIFGQLAGALAEAGYLVVRYDKRGLGQSGGLLENATVSSYAEDVVQVVKWLHRRKDVDDDRIAVLAHAEGGAATLTAAQQDKNIRAVGLLAATAQTGRDLALWQQARLLAKLNESEANKQAKIALQLRVMDAAVKGSGWETIPWEIRRQADTAWFRSWLLFDPIAAMAKVRQPILIVHGSLDTEVSPAQADRLEQLSRSRKKVPETYTRKAVIQGVNHLLVPAVTGEADEYLQLATKTISSDVITALTNWLKDTMPPKK